MSNGYPVEKDKRLDIEFDELKKLGYKERYNSFYGGYLDITFEREDKKTAVISEIRFNEKSVNKRVSVAGNYDPQPAGLSFDEAIAAVEVCKRIQKKLEKK